VPIRRGGQPQNLLLGGPEQAPPFRRFSLHASDALRDTRGGNDLGPRTPWRLYCVVGRMWAVGRDHAAEGRRPVFLAARRRVPASSASETRLILGAGLADVRAGAVAPDRARGGPVHGGPEIRVARSGIKRCEPKPVGDLARSAPASSGDSVARYTGTDTGGQGLTRIGLRRPGRGRP